MNCIHGIDAWAPCAECEQEARKPPRRISEWNAAIDAAIGHVLAQGRQWGIMEMTTSARAAKSLAESLAKLKRDEP